jgi:hypothetical protein
VITNDLAISAEIDYQNELIEKGYIYFPPREIVKTNDVKVQSQLNKIDQTAISKDKNEKAERINLDEKEDLEKKFKKDRNNANSLSLDKNNSLKKSIEKKEDENKFNLPNLGNAKSEEVRQDKLEELTNNFIAKEKTIKIDENSKLNINSNNTSYTYNDYSLNAILKIGIQNNFQKNSEILKTPSYTASGGIQLTKNTNIGFYYRGSKKRDDITLNTISNIPQTNLYTKISAGVMNGREVYNFYSGSSEVNLSQYNGLASIHYRNPNKFSNFKSVGLNVWKIIARQRTNFDPTYIVKETDTSYDTYMDPKKLSLGNVTGYSGAIRFKINNSISVEQGLGKERLVYPFSDGTKNITNKNYLKSSVKYYINEYSRLEAAYSTGVIENKSKIEYLNSGFGLSLENSRGNNGHRDYWFVGLTYTIIDPLNPSYASSYFSNNDEADYLEHKNLLEEVATRPIEFPSNFLAKVDPTSVKLVQSIKKGVINWSSNGLLGTYFDSISPSRNNIAIQLLALNSSNALVKYQTTLVSGSLPDGLTLDENGLISGTAAAVLIDTTYIFQVKAISEGATDQISQNLSIIIKAPSSISWVSSGTLASLNDSISPSRSNVSIQLDARTTSINPIVYETNLASGALPPGLTLNSSGLISGTTPQVNQLTTYTFTVNARTADVQNVQSSNLSIIIKPQTLVTWITSGSLASLQNCQSSDVNIALNATSNIQENITYSLNSGVLPSGLTLSSDGKITGTMAEVEANTTFNFTVKATSESGSSANSPTLSISKITNGFIYNASNNHYYKSFQASAITWDQAKTLAEGKSCGVLQGYLATIISNNELTFIDTKVYPTRPVNIFIGATSTASAGTWRWVTGPEGLMDGGQGLLFYSNNQIQNNLIAPWDFARGANPNATNKRHMFIYQFYEPKFLPWETGNLNSFFGSGTDGYLVEFGN